MARSINKLSALTISQKNDPGYYLDGAGLYLQVSKAGTKSWVFKYTLDSRSREMGLGSFNTVSLAEAREMARNNRQLLLQHQDPIEVRDMAAKARQIESAKRITFDECAKKYIATHRAGWKNPKHANQWENTLTTYCSPIMGSLYAADIDTGLILRCLESIWSTKTETATRVRGRIEKILDWATSRGYRKGENPARWKGHLEFSLAAPNTIAEVEHHPALPYKQIAMFIKELKTREGMAARALEFGTLTATRSGDIRGATWGEIDFNEKVWSIPVERMKQVKSSLQKLEKFHCVPLSDRAIDILKQRKAEAGETKPSEIIFHSSKNGELSDATLKAVIKRMNEIDGTPKWVDPHCGNRQITPHGMRAAFSTWAAECTTHNREIREKALAHVIGNETERAYQRGDLLEKRRALMTDWARYCETVVEVDNVVSIKSKTAA